MSRVKDSYINIVYIVVYLPAGLYYSESALT